MRAESQTQSQRIGLGSRMRRTGRIRAQNPVAGPNKPSDDEGDNRCGDKGVSDAAVMLETDNRPAEAPDNIQIGSLGGQGRCECGIGSAAVEAGAADAGSGEEVGYWLHTWILVAGD
jgi:hypothetical protein